ncbi:MAG: SRPBCC family protein [Bacteroidota bacterium]
MPIIRIETYIKADINLCFDLSISIDLHKLSTAKTNEEAIAGTTSGLIKLNETVTWQATHFGIRQKLTSLISAHERPFHFRDEQVKGAFRSFKHDHYFEQKGKLVLMTDIFDYESPYGILGKCFNQLVLTKYLTGFLTRRNAMIKEFAETGKWKQILF